MHALVHELVEHYADLRRYLMRELRDRAHAEDIAQSSFERVYVHALAADSPDNISSGDARNSGLESLRALLFRVARNLCIDDARHRKVVHAWAADRSPSELQKAAHSSEYVVAQIQILKKVAEALEGLPPRRREVFLLSRAYGYSHTEIAQHFSITEMAVAKHLVRAVMDCAQVFRELHAQLPEPSAPVSLRTPQASLAEDRA